MQISFAELHGYPVVRAEGDLTRATSPLLKDALEKAAAEQPAGILCDLRAVRPTVEGLPVFHVVLDGLSTGLTGPLVLLVTDPGFRDQLERRRVARRAAVVADVDGALEALRATPGYRRASITLEVGEDAAAVAEQFVVSLLTAWAAARCIDPARLVTAELVRNAVVHAGGEVRLHLSTDGPDVLVSVGDRGAGGLVPAARADGLGLVLVERVSERWGVLPRTGGGHLVWARLRCGRPAGAATGG